VWDKSTVSSKPANSLTQMYMEFSMAQSFCELGATCNGTICAIRHSFIDRAIFVLLLTFKSYHFIAQLSIKDSTWQYGGTPARPPSPHCSLLVG
jgi:hypothetical protein